MRLDGFVLNAEQGVQWQLYLDGQRTRVRSGSDLQLSLDAAGSPISAEDLAYWLARELQHPSRNRAGDVLPVQLRAFTLAAVSHSLHEQRLPLALNQYVLVQRLALRIAELREDSYVCELVDGRLAVIEYKGEQLRHAPKELHKAQVGRCWADSSGGRALFLMAYKLEQGLNVRQQLDVGLS